MLIQMLAKILRSSVGYDIGNVRIRFRVTRSFARKCRYTIGDETVLNGIRCGGKRREPGSADDAQERSLNAVGTTIRTHEGSTDVCLGDALPFARIGRGSRC